MLSRRLPDAFYFILALLLALTLRLVNLGLPALTDLEANWALQAMQAADGLRPAFGPFPAYLLPTALLFFLFEPTNFLARLLPALAGAALVFAPSLFRERIGRLPAILLAFALAVEPGLVAISRQAGTPILAVTFTLFAWGCWEHDRPRAAGLLAGLALLSGPAAWAGLLALALASALRLGVEQLLPADPSPSPAWRARAQAAWPVLLGTLLSTGLLFFLSSNGLSAALSALPEYLGGWTRPSGVPIGLPLIALLGYQLMGVLLAVIALARGISAGSRHTIALGLWLLTALLLALFYPARQVGDLAWMLIPLWALAASEIARTLEAPATPRTETLGTLALTFVILVFAWLYFLPLASLPVVSTEFTARLVLIGGALLLLVLSLALVALGWTPQIALRGGSWGALLALGLFTLSMALHAPGLRAGEATVELWSLGPRIAQADLLVEETNDRSEWNTGHDRGLPVLIVGLDSPALEWALRGREVTVSPFPDLTQTPALVVTGPVDTLGLSVGYRGQDFHWAQSVPPYPSATTWLTWFPFHRMPFETQLIILWVRDDLFMDGARSQ